MNAIALIILAALVIDFALSATAGYLNIKRLSGELPAAFRDVYDAQRYRRSQQYLRANTRFGWLVSACDLLLIVLFWFFKGFPLLDAWLRSWQMGAIGTGLLYIGTLVLAKSLLSLPFGLYRTFVIEARFGFNTTDVRTFAVDWLKSLALTVVLGAPLVAGILWFFASAGAHAWWICWIVVAVYMLGVQFIAPAWIMPLFNTFTPLGDGPLKAAIVSYARNIRFPLDNVLVMDGSRRSAKSNAFFTGFGRHRRIVLFDTLIDRHSVPELIAILAHEMGHYRKGHVLQMLAVGVIQSGVAFYLLSLFISYPGLFEAFYMPQPSVYAGMIFFLMLYTPIDFFMGIGVQALSRKNEFAADRFAAETTQNPEALADALKKLSVHNLSNLHPHPLYVFLNDAHPPVLNRLAALGKA